MKTRYLAHLQPRSAPTLRCGHTDCCYYTRDTDSCDYLLIEYRRRGCPPTPDCPCFAPAGRARSAPEAELGARIQAYTDMGQSVRQIARRLRISEVGVRRIRARTARRGAVPAQDAGYFKETP